MNTDLTLGGILSYNAAFLSGSLSINTCLLSDGVRLCPLIPATPAPHPLGQPHTLTKGPHLQLLLLSLPSDGSLIPGLACCPAAPAAPAKRGILLPRLQCLHPAAAEKARSES